MNVHCGHRTQHLTFLGPQNHFCGLDLTSHNFPTNRARELFNHSKVAESLLGSVLKNSDTIGFEGFSE